MTGTRPRGDGFQYCIDLPWVKPPLSLNDRRNRFDHARQARAVRHDTRIVTKAARITQPVRHVAVTLHYIPSTTRRRDTDNLMTTVKPICDGLIDAGLVADDTPEFMTRREPVIHPAAAGPLGCMWLILEVTHE